MKCLICNEPFLINSIQQILNSQQRCNKCANLFIYTKKNVKIDTTFITVFFCCYFENIKHFSEYEEMENFNRYVKDKMIKKKVFYDLQTIKNYGGFVNKKSIIIVYTRREFSELLIWLKQVIKINQKIRIKAYEVLDVNTKKTQSISG